MAPGKDRDHELLDHVFLPNNDLGQLVADAVVSRDQHLGVLEVLLWVILGVRLGQRKLLAGLREGTTRRDG